MDPAAAAIELHERAIALRDAGEYVTAEAAAREAVLLFEALEGVESADLAHALVERAQLLGLLDALPEAIACVERALAILTRLADAAGCDEQAHDLIRLTARAELTWASLQRCAGELAGAERACRRALRRVETSRLPDGGSATVEVLNELGVLHKLQGRFDEAEAVYRQAFELLEASGDADGDDAATLLHNLGGLAHARGDFATGEPLARRSVEQREQLFGRAHPVTAADRAAWAALLEGVGRLDDAESAYREALAVFETRLGSTSLEVAATLTGLGGIRRARGAVEAAEHDYRRALAIRNAKLGPCHVDVALTLNDLALVLVEREPAEALATARRALAIFEAVLGPSHPHTRTVAANVTSLAGPEVP